MNKIQKKLLKRIKREGKIVFVRKMKTKEVTEVDFRINFDDLHDEFSTYNILKHQEVKDQIDTCASLLKEDPSSRQAVIVFKMNRDQKELPNCFVAIQFLIRNEKLHVIVFQRSLDLINKFLGDQSFIRTLIEEVSKATSSTPSIIKWFIGSMHIYIEE